MARVSAKWLKVLALSGLQIFTAALGIFAADEAKMKDWAAPDGGIVECQERHEQFEHMLLKPNDDAPFRVPSEIGHMLRTSDGVETLRAEGRLSEQSAAEIIAQIKNHPLPPLKTIPENRPPKDPNNELLFDLARKISKEQAKAAENSTNSIDVVNQQKQAYREWYIRESQRLAREQQIKAQAKALQQEEEQRQAVIDAQIAREKRQQRQREEREERKVQALESIADNLDEKHPDALEQLRREKEQLLRQP